MYFDLPQCEEILDEWQGLLCQEVEDRTDGNFSVLPAGFKSELRPADHVRSGFDVGGCLVYLTPRLVHFNRYAPMLVVCEKRRRSQKRGVGHSRDYYMSRTTKLPSFGKAVANALQRSVEIAEGTGVGADFDFPPGVMATETGDGMVVLHIGMLQITKSQAQRIAAILRR